MGADKRLVVCLSVCLWGVVGVLAASPRSQDTTLSVRSGAQGQLQPNAPPQAQGLAMGMQVAAAAAATQPGGAATSPGSPATATTADGATGSAGLTEKQKKIEKHFLEAMKRLTSSTLVLNLLRSDTCDVGEVLTSLSNLSGPEACLGKYNKFFGLAHSYLALSTDEKKPVEYKNQVYNLLTLQEVTNLHALFQTQFNSKPTAATELAAACKEPAKHLRTMLRGCLKGMVVKNDAPSTMLLHTVNLAITVFLRGDPLSKPIDDKLVAKVKGIEELAGTDTPIRSALNKQSPDVKSETIPIAAQLPVHTAGQDKAQPLPAGSNVPPASIIKVAAVEPKAQPEFAVVLELDAEAELDMYKPDPGNFADLAKKYCPSEKNGETAFQAMMAPQDGCSVPGGWAPFIDTFQQACFRHDVCYDCGAKPVAVGDAKQSWSRDGCDNRFLLNMKRLCASKYSKGYIQAFQRGSCYLSSEAFFQAVSTFAGSHFTSSNWKSFCNSSCVYNYIALYVDQ